MNCNLCDRPLVRCICPDIDARIDALSKSPFLAIDFDALRAARELGKFDIERDRRADAAVTMRAVAVGFEVSHDPIREQGARVHFVLDGVEIDRVSVLKIVTEREEGKPFAPGETLIMLSPHTKEESEVGYRGPVPSPAPDLAVVVPATGGQMTIPAAWLSRRPLLPVSKGGEA